MMDLEQDLKKEATRQGFTLAGITTPAPPDHLAVYQRWLQAGLHGEMVYLERESALRQRADPRLLLPECQSILVVGMAYYPSRKRIGEKGEGMGRIAAYAWGEDYHAVIPERLEALVNFLERQLGRRVPYRAFTDSGPVLERELAQRAGLGWIGKNTCLIHPGQGSYFFLAELLLGLPLQPDAPFTQDRCGACRRCIEACPTGCIRPDRTLDARGCISYLTIELKGEIPEELRPGLGDWVFGCDICQQVCPWNRFAPEAGEAVFAPRGGVPAPDLAAELSLTEEQFREKFKGSPVLRTKRRGYLRNVAVALGNQGDAGAIPALERALEEDAESLVRGHAGWAVEQMQRKNFHRRERR
mgnify:CR=1 FL=1